MAEDNLIKEADSTSTEENMKYSKNLIGDNKRIAFCTSDYHLFRSCSYAIRAGFNHIKWAGAKTARYYYPSALIREFIGVLVMRKSIYISCISFVLIAYTLAYFRIANHILQWLN